MPNLALLLPPCDEGVIRAAPQGTPASASTGRWVLVITIIASSLVFIDASVVNLALPALQTDLNATVVDVQWVIEAYALFLAALILVGGSLGDRFGRRRIFAAGVALFAVASLGDGLAQTVGQLIASRVAQGIGGALLTPGSLAILSAAFGPAQRGRAIGTWAGVSSISGVLAPVLGGWLIEHASWRTVFLLNLPLAAVVLALSWWRLPADRDDGRTAPLDWPGAALATIGLGAVVYGLIETQSGGSRSPISAISLLTGIGALAAFVVAESRARWPILPLTLFRSRAFTATNLTTFLLYGACTGSLFFVPLDLIEVQSYSATAAGASLLPTILILSALSRWAGGLATRYSRRLMLTIGPAIAAAGFALFAVPGVGGNYWTTFFPATLVLGVGMGITAAPLTTTVMGTVKSRHIGIASAINNAAARVSGLLAIAVLSIVFVQRFDTALASRLDPLGLSAETRQAVEAQRGKLAEAEVPISISPAIRVELRRDIDESFISAFRVVLVIAVVLAVGSALSSFALLDVRGPVIPPGRRT